MLALVGRHVLSPQQLDGLQVFVGDRTPLPERDLQHIELALCPANADTENKPAAAKLIDVSQRPGRLNRIAVGDDDYSGADLHLRGNTGHPAQKA